MGSANLLERRFPWERDRGDGKSRGIPDTKTSMLAAMPPRRLFLVARVLSIFYHLNIFTAVLRLIGFIKLTRGSK